MRLHETTTGARSRVRRLDHFLFRNKLLSYQRAVDHAIAGDWQSLLDVGCGAVSAVDEAFARIPLTVGIDAHAPTIERRRENGPYTRYECIDALGAAERFGPLSFDVVVAMDVVEHFEKPEGLRLLSVLETVARRKVIIFTPNGFLSQGELDGNTLQQHRSGWDVKEFLDRGYEVVGVNGWRPLRGPLCEPRIRPAALGDRLSAITQPLVAKRPSLAFQLLAVLDLPIR